MGRLILVCNRANPPRENGGGTLGGVPVALAAALKQSDGFWFGWSGETVINFTGEVRVRSVDGAALAAVDLEPEDADEYYNGYANNALWQVFHYRPSAYDSSSITGYERLSARFAEALVKLIRAGDRIWVHDYQLIPLAQELRTRGIQNPIGFFLHIPWPPRQLVAMLPEHRRLVRALFAYDLAGFHTEEWRRAFEDYVCEEFRGACVDGRVRAFGRELRAGAFPVGIDAAEFAAAARGQDASAAMRRMKDEIGDKRLILSVDRLDYPKGLEERLAALEAWLAREGGREGAVFLQIAPGMSDATRIFCALKARVEELTRGINARFATEKFAPVLFVNRMHRRHELAGLYRAAAVGLVTPLCDGMNLVAKEYVAAQDPMDPGVLVLSRFAGAAAQMNAALIVNPFSRGEVGDALDAALHMGREERVARWSELMEGVRSDDVNAWCVSFLEALAECTSGRGREAANVVSFPRGTREWRPSVGE